MLKCNNSDNYTNVNSIDGIVHNPTHPDSSVRNNLEEVTDKVYHSLEVAKFETSHLSPPTYDLTAIVREVRSRRLDQVLPPLTGRYRVGHGSFVIDGPKKSCGIGDYKIGIEIFAPTQTTHGNKISIKLNPEDELLKILSREQIQTLYTRSLDQIDPVGKMPILIFSHGYGVDPMEYRPLLEEIASHGILVLNLNHPSSSGNAPFSKGALVPFENDLDCERLALGQRENIRFVLHEIRNGKLKELHDLGLPNQILLAGHSLGGIASIKVDDPKIMGCINLDGHMVGSEETRTKKPSMPVVMILADHVKDQSDDWKRMKQDWVTFSKHPSVESHTIEGIEHSDFSTIYRAYGWLFGNNTMESALKTHEKASQIMVEFISRTAK
jgi:hypothetical protein